MTVAENETDFPAPDAASEPVFRHSPVVARRQTFAIKFAGSVRYRLQPTLIAAAIGTSFS